MRYIKFALAAALVLFAAASCKTEYELLLEGNDTDAKYKAAFKYYEDGKFSKAAQLFENLSVITSGTERDDTVQYYWGLSNYAQRDFYTAETNFEHFLERYPRSPFAESAQFMRIDCLYKATLRYELDQTPTYTAITKISEYLTEHPTGANAQVCHRMLKELGERLDKKAFENALLYYKMEDYKAARVALRNVLKDDAENVFREDILYYTAMASYKFAQNSYARLQKERYLVFIDDYLNFIGEFPGSPHCKELEALYQKVKEK